MTSSTPIAHAVPETATSPRRTLARRGPAPLALEPRIMFDGATADAAVAAAAGLAGVPGASAEPVAMERPDMHVAAAVLAAPPAQRNEVMFVTDNLQDGALLATAARPGVEVIVLDHTRDGLQQMIDTLAGRPPVNAIHLVTHGADGRLAIGASSVTAENVDSYAERLAQLGQHMVADADLLVYGCDVAAGADGQVFIDRLAQLTGADVAASSDRTARGDWELETRSGSVETAAMALDTAGWDGVLAAQTSFDANQQQLVFQNKTTISGTGGAANGDVVRFNNVITIGGQVIDAVVTTTIDRASIGDYDSNANPSTTTAYFQPTLTSSAAGGNATFTITFYLGGTYTGAGTGTAATLQNVIVNSYDIDSIGGGADRQFQSFKGFARYQLSTGTFLVPTVQSDGSVTFLYTPTGSPVNNGTVTNDNYRVRVYYDSMSTFQVNAGVAGAAAQAYFAFDFSLGPAWGGGFTTTGTPAPNLSYSSTVFTEAAANDGSIAAKSTITLANGSFTGVDGAAITGVSYGNVPAGLIAQVTRTSATTAELSFTGSATAHANANDIGNLSVSFGNTAFASGNAGAVTGASRGDLSIDFANPPLDTTAPVVVASQAFSWLENRSAGTQLGVVSASDASGVTGFRFAATGTTTSADGWFAIGADGRVTLTTAGAAAAANDYETGANSFTHAVQAGDGAGNWSASVNLGLSVTDVDEVAPAFTSSTSANSGENQALLYTAAATDLVQYTDGTVTYSLKAGAGDAALLAINTGTGAVRLANGNLDFESKTSYSFTVVARDATGNTREQAVSVGVVDADEVPPSVAIATDRNNLKAGENAVLTFTFSEDVGASFDAGDVVVSAGSLGPLARVDGSHYTATYTPAVGATGSVSIGVAASRVQDGAGNTNALGATLMLSLDTAAPVISGPGNATGATSATSIAENTTALHTFTANEAVTWSLGGGEDAAYFVLSSGGTLSFAAAPDYETPLDGATGGANTYLVDVVALDAAGNSSTQGVTVTVLNSNELPRAAAGAFTTAEDAAYSGSLPVALDADGDMVAYALATGPSHGSVSVAPGGSYTYTPDANYNGADSFSYTVSDGNGGSNTYAMTVTVTPLNDAPVAAAAAITTAEDTIKSGALPAALDADGDIVTYAKASDPSHGSVTVTNTGNYSYTPTANYIGADSFTYTVSDGNGGSNTYTVNITVTPTADAPVAAPASITTLEDIAHTGTLPVATDADGDTVTYSVATGPSHGNVSVTAVGSYAYTPVADYHGADSFSYTVSDGNGGINTYTVSVTVTPTADAPVAAAALITTSEDTVKSGNLPAAFDADGDTVTYAKASDPSHGSITVSGTGNYSYTPAANYTGTDSFSYTVGDGNGGTNTYTVSITVAPSADAPVAAPASITTPEDTAQTGTLPVATDADGDTVTYSVAIGPSHGSVSVTAAGSYTYTPFTDYHGVDSFSYTVSDGGGVNNTYAVDVTVTPATDIPVAAPASITTAEDTVKSGALPAAFDADGDTVTYTKVGDPAHGAVTVETDGSYTYTPNANYAGNDNFSYSVSDASGGSNTYTVSVNVTPVNDAPVAAPAAITTPEDTALTGSLSAAFDADGDVVTYAKASDPSHGSVRIGSDGTYTYTPQAEFAGTDSFSYSVSDPSGSTDTQTVTVTVTPLNDAPVAAPAMIVIAEDSSYSGALPASTDADDDAVIYALAGVASNGSVTVRADGGYTYVPNANFNGADSFRYSVSDGKGGSNTYTVTIIATPVNDAPQASSGAITTLEDTAAGGMLPAPTDADGDTVSYALVGEPAHGSVSVSAAGAYTYTPHANYHGTDSFSYAVSDGAGGGSTYTIAVIVTPANDAPLAAPETGTTFEDTALHSNLPGAIDADGDAIIYALTRNAVHGVVTVAPDGSYVYAPDANYHGPDSFGYSVSDGKGGNSTYTVELTVTPVNDAPQDAGGINGTGIAGVPLALVSVPAFTDVDGPAITYTATLADGSPLPAWLVFDPAGRSVTGTPPAGSAGTWNILITGSDGALSDTSLVTITVANPPSPAQAVAIEAMTKDTGQSARDFITTDGSTGRSVSGRISAPLERNQAVQVSFDGATTWTTAQTSGTAWTAIDATVHEANWTIAARVVNTVTGQTGVGATQGVVLDAATPAAPTVDRISTGSPTPVLSGTATLQEGETLRVTVNGATYLVTPQGGNWVLDLATTAPVAGALAPLAPGQRYEVVATVSDPAGNVRSGDEEGTVSVAVPVVTAEPLPVVDAAAPIPLPVVASPAPVLADPAPVAQVIDAVARTLDSVVPGSLVGTDTLQYGSGSGLRPLDGTGALSLRGAELSDVYTRSEGFRTVVAKAEEPALVLFQGVPDQFVDSGAALSLTIPADAFAHTQPKAIVRLVAVQQDGRPLPTWVEFNGQTGQLTGEVPKGLKGELRVKLVARDAEGREATALFRINIGQDKGGENRTDAAPVGKPGLSQQLRNAQPRR